MEKQPLPKLNQEHENTTLKSEGIHLFPHDPSKRRALFVVIPAGMFLGALLEPQVHSIGKDIETAIDSLIGPYPDFPSIHDVHYTYNREKATMYADKFALLGAQGFEDGSITLPFPEDCTNYISCCLFAGGIPMNQEWNAYFIKKITKRLKIVKDYEQTSTWKIASELYDFLLKYQLGEPLPIVTAKDTNSSSDLIPGDLIFYDFGEKDNFGEPLGISHVAIVSENQLTKTGTYNSLVDEHTSYREKVQWTLAKFLPKSQENTRIHRLHLKEKR